MLANSTPVAFLATAKTDLAKASYADVLGLELRHEDSFALVFEVSRMILRFSSVAPHTPAPFTVFGWVVDDAPSTVRQLRAAGVNFERFEGMGQDDDDISTTPDGSQVAWFKDPDGNLLSVTQLR